MSLDSKDTALARVREKAALEKALAEDTVLDRWQRINARAKYDDLSESRLEWASIPFRLMVEFNRRCNTRCRMCPIEHSSEGVLQPSSFERVLDEMGRGAFELIPFVSGEPTLAPLEQVAGSLRRRNMYFNITTNGALLDEHLVRGIEDVTARVNVSLQSHRPEIQEHLVPGLSHCRILAHLKFLALRAAALEFEAACSCVVLDSNVRELSGYVQLLAEIGIRRWIVQRLYPWGAFYEKEKRAAAVSEEEKTHLVRAAIHMAADLGICVESNFGHGIPALSGPRIHSRFRSLDEQRFVVDLARPGFCPSLANTAVFTADGTLRPCCRHPIDLGSISQHRFLDLWNGPAMRTLRQQFFERSLRPACVACRTYEASGMEQTLASERTDVLREAQVGLS